MKKKQRSETSEGEARNDAKTSTGREAESFGPWLRRQREMREIDLREIADSSKISLRYLQAFEENRFEELPADVFAKGFLRHYARFVGIDAEEAVNFFAQARKEAAQNQQEDEITRVVRIRSSKSSSSSRRESANRRFVLVILLAATLLLFLVWQLSRWQKRQEVAETPPPAVAIPAPGTLKSAPAEAPATDPAATAANTPATEGTVPTDGAPLGPAPLGPGTAATNPDGSAATVPGTAPAAAPTSDPALALQQQQVNAGDLIRVSLDFQGQCWVEAMVDGKRQQSATRAQGEAVTFAGNELIEFKLGDYHSVQLEVNGQPVTIQGDPGRGSTKRLRIDLPYVASLTGVPLETLQQALAQRKKTGSP